MKCQGEKRREERQGLGNRIGGDEREIILILIF